MAPPPTTLLPVHWLWLVIAVVAFVQYVVLAVLGDPFNFGTILPLVVACIGFAVVAMRRTGRPIPTLPARWRRAWLTAVVIMGAWYISMTTWMFIEARSEQDQPVDMVLILGAGLKSGRPSPALERRIQAAAGYLLSHPEAMAIACGGVGPGQPRSEAEVIRHQLVERGVVPERIMLEEHSTSTAENVRFAHAILKERVRHERPRVLIITSNFHLARAKMLARHMGLEAFGLPASTPWYILPNNTARESFAIIKSLVADLR